MNLQKRKPQDNSLIASSPSSWRPTAAWHFWGLLSADLNREPPRGAAHPLRRG
jgi:hypothetical protein